MRNNLINLQTDFLIVGGGTIGLFLFNELKKLNKKVILIEKGSKDAKLKKTKDIISRKIFHKGTFNKRAFGIGGNSTLWGGQLVEFLDQNQEKQRYELGLKKNELNNLYRQLYKIFEIKKVSAKEYLKKNNLKFNNKEIKYFFSNWLKEPNFAKYYKEILSEYAEDIFLNSKINKINFINKNIKSIEVTHKNKKLLVETKKCIITMGTIETIKFFLKNKKKFNLSNKVGEYFQDHVGIFAGDVEIIDKKKFSQFFENGIIHNSKYQPKLFYQELKNEYSLGASGEFKFYSKHNFELSMLKKNLRNFLKYKSVYDLLNVIKYTFKLNFKILSLIYLFIFHKKIKSFYDKGIKFYIQSEQIPLSKSCIKFIDLKKKFVQSWEIDGKELDFIKNFAIKTNKILKKEKIAKINLTKFLKLNQTDFKKILRDTNHPAGGLILRNKKREGVVDKNFRIYGVNNMFVIGSCLFSKSSFANITFTTLALALKFINRVKSNV